MLPVVLVAVVVLLALPSFAAPGHAQDEGVILAGAERVRAGAVPHRDFLTLYGPGAFWVVAATFAIVEPSVLAERFVGLAYHIAIVVGAFAVVRPLGIRLAAVAAVIAALFLTRMGLAAFAWAGAYAALLWALVPLGRADATSRHALASGALCGLASVFRIEVGAIAAVAALPLLVQRDRALFARFSIGFAGGLVPLGVHVAMASPTAFVEGFLVNAIKIAPAARLPLPPQDATDATLFFLVSATGVVALAAGALRAARDPAGVNERIRLSLGLLAIGLLPQALQRADEFHLLYVGAVVVALLPVALAAGLEYVDPRRPAAASSAAIAMAALALFLLAPRVVVTSVFHVGLVAGIAERAEHWVEHRGRSFPLDSETSVAHADAVLQEVERVRDAGRVIVGPRDLSRTYYTDTYLYFLLPHHVPGTYYLEMVANAANRVGSRLPSDVARADLLILTSRYDSGFERWTSAGPGDTTALDVVRECFVAISSVGPYEVLRRRDDAAGRSCHPATQ